MMKEKFLGKNELMSPNLLHIPAALPTWLLEPLDSQKLQSDLTSKVEQLFKRFFN